jgi:hypothetical protein
MCARCFIGSYIRYNFSKVAQYKQLTLEEAEEKMNKRKTSATGYERWMMKAATNGPAAFGSDMKKLEPTNDGEKEGARPKKGKDNEDGNNSDKGEENEEEEADRKDRLGLSKRGMDDDEEGGKDLDFDLDDDIEKGLFSILIVSEFYCSWQTTLFTFHSLALHNLKFIHSLLTLHFLFFIGALTC